MMRACVSSKTAAAFGAPVNTDRLSVYDSMCTYVYAHCVLVHVYIHVHVVCVMCIHVCIIASLATG